MGGDVLQVSQVAAMHILSVYLEDSWGEVVCDGDGRVINNQLDEHV